MRTQRDDPDFLPISVFQALIQGQRVLSQPAVATTHRLLRSHVPALAASRCRPCDLRRTDFAVTEAHLVIFWPHRGRALSLSIPFLSRSLRRSSWHQRRCDAFNLSTFDSASIRILCRCRARSSCSMTVWSVVLVLRVFQPS